MLADEQSCYDSVPTRGRARRRARAGFSLIELLAVIVILGILIAFLVPRLGGAADTARVRECETRLHMLATAIGEYENEFGRYPPSRFDPEWGAPPNATNQGAEALVVALWSPDWGGTNGFEKFLANSDGDQLKKSLTTMPTTELLEVGDPWENPIAYFERTDYAREDRYAMIDPDTGEAIESLAKALVNPTTGRAYEPNRFQLVSAGPDGAFGTDDDVTNFGR
jgi:prepilin-type N-terminal cleavage/methylation domain-containing protein